MNQFQAITDVDVTSKKSVEKKREELPVSYAISMYFVEPMSGNLGVLMPLNM